MKPAWSIVEYRGHDGLRQLEADWKRLLAAMPERGPQHAYEMHLAYFTHFVAEGRFTCLALTDGERVSAICPLELATEYILGRPTPCWGLACRQHGLLLDVICPAGEPQRELLPNIVRFFRRAPSQVSWLVFDRVLEGSALWQCLAGLDRKTYFAVVVGATDVIRCDRPFEELASGFSKVLRGSLRKARNRLDDLADVRFASASGLPSLANDFESFVDLEASGWKGEAGTRSAMKYRPDQLAFHRQLSIMPWDEGRCEINTLHAEGVCIAAEFCVRAGAVYQSSRIAHDERYAHCSPGSLLLAHTLRRCCEDPEIERYNLVSHSDWHAVWRPEVIPSYWVYIGLGRRSGPLFVRLLRLRVRCGPHVKRWLEGFSLGARLVRWLRGSRGP